MINQDVFVEQIVVKKVDAKVFFARFGLAVLLIALIFADFYFLGALMQIAVILFAALIYGYYRLYVLFNIEYEYIITNGEVDIDKIVNRAKRKRMASFKIRDCELIAKANDPEYKRDFESQSFKTKLDFSNKSDNPDNFFVICNIKDLGRTRIVLTPAEKVLAQFRLYAPRQFKGDLI